jgi:hypothetical protein
MINSPYAPSPVILSALVLSEVEGAKELDDGGPKMLRCVVALRPLRDQHDTGYDE